MLRPRAILLRLHAKYSAYSLNLPPRAGFPVQVLCRFGFASVACGLYPAIPGGLALKMQIRILYRIFYPRIEIRGYLREFIEIRG
jgi:hypothetical protein